ncbi:hypothetical protein [Cohnella soli]|uniref:Uncharacterized protein n=1 Tax=Cohnella soli TaxID=425005 RepID=A0ABW0HMF2_9BACL
MNEEKGTAVVESKKLTITDIKKALKAYDKETLLSIILDYYKQSPEVSGK